MPVPRAETAAASIGGVLYVAPGGGCPSIEGCQTLLSYDPKTDTWSSKATLPFRDAPCAAVLDGKFYVLGGTTFNASLSDVEAFDPQTNTWEAKSPMPEARAYCAAGAVNGILYVAGGFGPTQVNAEFVRATLWAYDPKSDSWTAKAPMPTPIAQAAAGVIGGIFYVAGGGPPQGSSIGISPATYAYDPKTDSWSTKAPMPTPRANAAGAVLDGKLYVVGGVAFNSSAGYGAVEAYDPTTDAWTTGPPLPTGRGELAAGVVDEVLYAVGGISGQTPFPVLAVNEAFTPFLMVSIDIKPGDATNTINLKSNGVVPVAILGSATFDPMTVDPTTVTFAGAHVALRGRGVPMTGQSDVNGDGYPDLVLYFRTQDMTDLKSAVGTPPLQQAGDHRSPLQVEAVLYGTTYSGQRIRGSGMVRIVPAVQTSAPTFPRGRGTQPNGPASTGVPHGQGRVALGD